MTTDFYADVAVLIVGFRNPSDVVACLHALSQTASEPSFDVFICENGGALWYNRLLGALVEDPGPCCEADGMGNAEHRCQFPDGGETPAISAEGLQMCLLGVRRETLDTPVA